MPDFVTVARVSDVPPGGIKQVEVDGQKIALANAGGTFYAVQDLCSHEEGNLWEGELEGDTIMCPWHFSVFSLKTGEVLAAPATEPIRTYPVSVQGDEIKIARPGT